MTISINKFVAKSETQALPVELQQSLEKIQQTLDGFNVNSTAYQNMNEALGEFKQVMTELKPVLQQINEKPNSLVFGEKQVVDPLPVKGIK